MKTKLLPNSFVSLARAGFLGALGVLHVGCNKSATDHDHPSAHGKPKVALVMKSLANEFFSTMAEGAQRHQATNAGRYDLVVNGIKNETDLAEQVNLVEQMIAEQVNAIVIAPADSHALVTVLKHAKETGILGEHGPQAGGRRADTGGPPSTVRGPGQSCRGPQGGRSAREIITAGLRYADHAHCPDKQ